VWLAFHELLRAALEELKGQDVTLDPATQGLVWPIPPLLEAACPRALEGPRWKISTVLAVERASSCSPTSGQGNAVSFYGRG
jgi:hypothetical protein